MFNLQNLLQVMAQNVKWFWSLRFPFCIKEQIVNFCLGSIYQEKNHFITLRHKYIRVWKEIRTFIHDLRIEYSTYIIHHFKCFIIWLPVYCIYDKKDYRIINISNPFVNIYKPRIKVIFPHLADLEFISWFLKKVLS